MLSIDNASNEPPPDLSSRLETFVGRIRTELQNQIYESLTSFELELLHAPDSQRINPCDLRRLLPVHVLDVILLALPAANFTLGSNGRNINGKLRKAANVWDVQPIHILFSIGFDYEPQGQRFFAALLELADALPNQFDTAIAQLCAQARSRREGIASATRTRPQPLNQNNKRTLSLVHSDVQAVLASIQAPRPNKKSSASSPGTSATTTKVGPAESLGSLDDDCTSQAKAPSATPAQNTTTEYPAPPASPATQDDIPERSELLEIGRRSDLKESVDFDPFAASEQSPTTGSPLFLDFGDLNANGLTFDNTELPQPDNTPVYDERDDLSYNYEESQIDPTNTKLPTGEPDPPEELDPFLHFVAAPQSPSLPKPRPTQQLQ